MAFKLVVEVEDDAGADGASARAALESYLPYLRLAINNMGFVVNSAVIERL
ncbi:hypothetical protein [Mycobacterium sp. 1465703.0]|uniref:hypothetical protein n=1 Tax=Mycobacterium sp. 1465703.0 TaxID=1834078 RepID=UPI0012EA110D|nr:hypothetical protein [Mycobacterium sp. 1465703.0]